MKFLKALFNVAKAKDAEAAEKIEDSNAVALGKQDLDKMQEDLNEATKNLGTIKGRIKSLEREISEKEEQLKTDGDKIQALIGAGKEALAEQLAARYETTEQEVENLKVLVKQQKDLAGKHEVNKTKLATAIQQCEGQLRMMQTMEDVSKSNEALTTINTAGATSALSKFQERAKKMQQRLDTTEALVEEQETSDPGNLDKEVNLALGKTPGAYALARFKSKMSS